LSRIPQLVHRVYEAELVPDGTPFLVAVSSVRETSLREEISLGQRLIRLVEVVAETRDRNEARALAGGVEM